MPCDKKEAIEVKRGTICKTRLNANVTIGYAHPVPAQQLSLLYVETQWLQEDEDRDIVLRFRPLAKQGGDIVFNNDQGEHTRTFEGNSQQYVAIYGKSVTPGAEADVSLDVVIDDDVEHRVPVTIRRLSTPPLDQSLGILNKELGIAAKETRPTTNEEQQIWDRYNAIFDDAKLFSDALASQELTPATVPTTEGTLANHSFTRPEIIAHLKSHRDPEGLANAQAKGKTNAFDPFQGHWRGDWRQKNSCGFSLNECQDHDWRPTAALNTDPDIYVQPVVLGPDSRPNADPPRSCFDFETGRDRDFPAMNAINIKTGVIIGAVGVKDQPDEQGIQSQRPHVGFYIEHGKLLWVAEEHRTDDVVTYSVFYEISQGEERETVDDQRYTIIGFQFGWHRTEKRIITPLETKAGQYRKILTESETQLEQQFRDRHLQPEHLQEMRYRRRLESFPSETIAQFQDNATPNVQDFLARLLDFIQQQEALRAAPLGDRESITFIMGLDPPGSNNLFYRAATAHFTLHPEGQLNTDLRTLEEVREFLEDNPPHNGHPWGEVNIVVHANEEGDLSIPVVPVPQGVNPATRHTNPRTLREALDDREFLPLPDRFLDVRSVIRIRGCAIGRSQEMVTLLGKAFGDDETQRPVISAPRHLQGYEFGPRRWRPGNQNPPTQTEQFFVEFWMVGFPQDQRPARAALEAQFNQEFPHAGVNWNAALRNPGTPAGDRAATEQRTRTHTFQFTQGYVPVPANNRTFERTLLQIGGQFSGVTNVQISNRSPNPDGTIQITFGHKDSRGNQINGSFLNVGPPPPANRVQQMDFLNNQEDLRKDLTRLGYTIHDYSWGIRFNDASIGNGQREWTINATGNRTIVRVERELREPDPANPGQTQRQHPQPIDLTHFGEARPARPAEHALGENVVP